MEHLRAAMPTLWGQAERHKELVEGLPQVYREVSREHGVPLGLFHHRLLFGLFHHGRGQQGLRRLRAGGLVLLGIPTARHDNIVYPGHREYGPVRLPKMIAGFQMLGRVWDGKVVHGGLEAAEMPPLLYAGKGAVTGAHGKNATDDRWQHEQVLVLQKKQ